MTDIETGVIQLYYVQQNKLELFCLCNYYLLCGFGIFKKGHIRFCPSEALLLVILAVIKAMGMIVFQLQGIF